MYETAYDLVALGMRYFFLALIVYILVRLVLHSLREYRAVQEIKQHVRSFSPGYIEILAPEAHAGEIYHLRHENTIGSGKACDIRLEGAGLASAHAFLYLKKDGLYLAALGSRDPVLLNDKPVGKHEELLYTADELRLGEVSMLLHLYGEEPEEEEEQAQEVPHA
ncbi:FHA domain-containing protein [Christensenellaceae bacterium OttesenSCG-928-L17]|nr:FHA domain-containing protein [Christensenellaceae bacterium OttesenSCG-928-L17]